MSVHAISWALKQPIQSMSAKFVLVVIANYADAYGRCWPSQRALAADTSMSERSIRSAISKLEELGILKRVERRRRDGSRASDILKIIAPLGNHDQPEDFAGCMDEHGEPTGKIFRINRKSTTIQPEKISGLTTFEPSKNHQRNHSSSASPPKRAETVDRFDDFWAVYPKRGLAANPKKPAREKFARAVKAGANPEVIISAAHRYADIERKAGRFGTDKVAQALTWLNQERWGDYPDSPPPIASQVSSLDVFGRG